MFMPFRLHSLTRAVDDQIHRRVRQATPVMYWAFRISDLVGRLGVHLMMSVLFLALVVSWVFRAQLQQGGTEYDQALSLLSQILLACAIPGVAGVIAREALHKQLQPVVLRAAQAIG
jgi:hypothetical protein